LFQLRDQVLHNAVTWKGAVQRALEKGINKFIIFLSFVLQKRQ